MYKDTCFAVAPMEQIEQDLREARAQLSTVRRIFLVNADPFVLSAAKLKAIAEKINEIFPEIQTISAYASVKNIIGKTDEELKELRRTENQSAQYRCGIRSGQSPAPSEQRLYPGGSPYPAAAFK
jgi:coproporphyrinogen III oxidase-like Fe-S oxidoreductase